ncbi:Membrane fusion protein of RND family multidrug efflux pump [Cronobacter malonaticus 681]|nr:Membrane fusion protein of RND family multidrug efflux pump [Cronobacter malonaticus 681]
MVMVVNEKNQVENRSVTTSQAIKENWLVTSGLKTGEKVIVSGLQKAHPGVVVTPVSAPAK